MFVYGMLNYSTEWCLHWHKSKREWVEKRQWKTCAKTKHIQMWIQAKLIRKKNVKCVHDRNAVIS